MRCLLVGAGAVGQVYGRHLVLGGASVTFFVKPKYDAETRAGFAMYPLNEETGRREAVRFEDFDVVTSVDEVASASFDFVILCVSSTALRAGSWLAELAAAMGEATLVSLTPGLEDLTLIGEHVPSERVMSGLIGLLSYHAPLPGGSVPEPGTAYWFPPMSKAPFSGPSEETAELVQTLRAGGFPTRVAADVTSSGAFGSAVLQSQIIALEIAGWSFASLRADRSLFALAFRAAKEALRIASTVRGTKLPWKLRALRPFMLKTAMAVARRAAPLDLERFFEVHFTKVADQTEAQLESWLAAARERDLEASSLGELRERLLAVRGHRAKSHSAAPS